MVTSQSSNGVVPSFADQGRQSVGKSLTTAHKPLELLIFNLEHEPIINASLVMFEVEAARCCLRRGQSLEDVQLLRLFQQVRQLFAQHGLYFSVNELNYLDDIKNEP